MKKLLPSLILIISLLLTACGTAAAPVQPTPALPEGSEMFRSDATAIDFLEGKWTNKYGNYIAAMRSNNKLIAWDTDLEVPLYKLYMLINGVLRGSAADGSTADVLSFQRVDDDTIIITQLYNGQSDTYMRYKDKVDTDRLDNDYVFWSMRNAAPYLTGMWLDEEGCYLIFGVSNGNVSLSSNLVMPDCDYIDFYDLKLCGYVAAEKDGEQSLERKEIFSFDILAQDKMRLTALADGSVHELERFSRELSVDMLDSQYVFANNQRAFAFLEGRWSSVGSWQLTVENQNGSISWNTTLPLDKSYDSYTFEDGAMVGVRLLENGEELREHVYDFHIISNDEIEITYHLFDTQGTVTLTREIQ